MNNLAQAELYLILAAMFRQSRFDVSEVSRDWDIDVIRDFIVGVQAPESPGILVKVHSAE